jgi:CheY-like chemotaxis protein
MLIEDSDTDVMIFRRAIKELKVTNPVMHKTDGQAALESLRNDSDNRPCVIVLDLNMPNMNGIEFLKIVKNDDVLRQIPVIVMTTSEDERDKLKSYEFSVAGYIVKPTEYKEFLEAIRTLDSYWTLSEMPSTV